MNNVSKAADKQTLPDSNSIDIEAQLTLLEGLGRIYTGTSDELVRYHTPVPTIKNYEVYVKAFSIAFISQFSRYFLILPAIPVLQMLHSNSHHSQTNRPDPKLIDKELHAELHNFIMFSLSSAVILSIALLAMHHIEKKDNLQAAKTQSKPKLLFFRRPINNHPMTAFFTLQLASSLLEYSLEPSSIISKENTIQIMLIGSTSILSCIALFHIIKNDYLKLFAALSFCKEKLSPLMERTTAGIEHTTSDYVFPCLKKTGQTVLPPLTGIISNAGNIAYEHLGKPLEAHLDQDSNTDILKSLV